MVHCSSCGKPLGDAQTPFCPFCGKATSGNASPAHAVPLATPQGSEETIFEGRPAVFASIGAVLLSIITVGIAALVLWIRSLGTHYLITTQRIVMEIGVFSKRLEQIDLYRVTDFAVERPFGQRLMGTGNIIVQSMDKDRPEARLNALKGDVRALYERMRAAAEVAKRRTGMRVGVVDYE